MTENKKQRTATIVEFGGASPLAISTILMVSYLGKAAAWAWLLGVRENGAVPMKTIL